MEGEQFVSYYYKPCDSIYTIDYDKFRSEFLFVAKPNSETIEAPGQFMLTKPSEAFKFKGDNNSDTGFRLFESLKSGEGVNLTTFIFSSVNTPLICTCSTQELNVNISKEN